MEQARLFLAIALSFLVFLLWHVFFVERKEVQKPVQDQQVSDIEKQDPYQEDVEPFISKVEPAFTADTPTPDRPSRTITINTPLYSAKISSEV